MTQTSQHRTPLHTPRPSAGGLSPRPWRAPTLETLPELVDLTLQSPVWGGEGGFSYLDAVDRGRRLG